MITTKDEIMNFIKSKVRCFDGGTGSMLFRLGWGDGKCPETAPAEIIQDIHRLYLESGAQFLTTNTFGANCHKLANYGLEHKVKELNSRNASLAKKLEFPNVTYYVVGDIGPTGKLPEPYGDTTFDEFNALFREQAEALLDGGADLFIIETMSAIEELEAGVKAVKDICDKPVIGSMTFNKSLQGYNTMMGIGVKEAVKRMREIGCDVIGSNCSLGPEDFVGLIKEIKEVAQDIPVLAEPNAGQPHLENGRTIYQLKEGVETYLWQLLEAGAVLVGGCCGTDEKYVKTLRRVVDQWNNKKRES